MGTFNKDAVLIANPSLIPAMARQIETEFREDGFTVQVDTLSSGGADISLSKGNVFKAVLGMKSALKITLTPQVGAIHFEAKVGIFGQQVIPSLISWFALWPVLITQIWGLVQQAKLDDKAYAIASRVAANHAAATATGTASCFCPSCGTRIPAGSKFCPNCGNSLNL